jgi:hypothetical protein
MFSFLCPTGHFVKSSLCKIMSYSFQEVYFYNFFFSLALQPLWALASDFLVS